MKQVQMGDLLLWQFDHFSSINQVRHYVSGRYGNQNGHTFTLSYSSTPHREEVKHNRHLLAQAMAIPDHHLFFPSQVHKTRIVCVTHSTTIEDVLDTDALVTNTPGLCINVMSADCVPILLYDHRQRAVAAVHAGWRGTVAKIVEKTLVEMQRLFGTKGEDILAGIGPSVSQDSYEVGEEVIEEVNKAFGNAHDLLLPQANGKAKLDLWKANALQLINFGVLKSNIELADLCTVKNNNQFFSARKGDAGRFAAGIMLLN
jgi:YfiH family protein